MTPLLEGAGLTKQFGGLRALSDVSITVNPGRVVGIIGPNGAGKTTLVNVVTGHLKPTSGQITVQGRPMTGQRPWVFAKAGVARTFQLIQPFRAMSVRDNVTVSGLFGAADKLSVRTARRVADEMLEKTGLVGRGDDNPADLPTADARRLELARALAMAPRVLLLDEVFAGLRAEEINPLVDLLCTLRDEGLGLIVVEHVLRALLRLADELVVLNFGRQIAGGSPKEVLADPVVVEAYLGTEELEDEPDDDR